MDEFDLHEDIIVMGSTMGMDYAAAQSARRESGAGHGSLLRLGEGVRTGRLMLDAMTDDGKAALESLIDRIAMGAVLRVPIAQIDPPRANTSPIVRPSVQIPAITNAISDPEGYGAAVWTLSAEPEAAWLNRLGQVGRRTFRVITIDGVMMLVTPDVRPAAGVQPKAPATAVMRIQQTNSERVPILRRAMSVQPTLSADIGYVEVIT